MALHEYMKDSKVIEEMYLYLLEKGYKEVSSSINITKDTTEFTFDVKIEGNELSKNLENDLYCSRDLELEEYGWELTDSHFSCELTMVGILIDDFKIIEENGICEIVLYRKKTK